MSHLVHRHLVDEADERSGYQISQAPPKILWYIQKANIKHNIEEGE